MRVTCLILVAIVAISGCRQPDTVSQVDTEIDKSVLTRSVPEAALPVGPQEIKITPPPLAERPQDSLLSNSGDVSFGTTDAVIIDTRNFKKQIYRDKPFAGEQKSSSIFRPVKRGKPGLEIGPPNDLVTGSVVGPPIVGPQAFFPGISSSPWTPPDPALAVGPNHVVQTVNMELAFFNKETGALEFQQRLDSSGDPGFFEEVGGETFCFDPKCYYDPGQKRYFVLALEVYGRNSGSGEGWITFAVSDDDDPHGVWYKYRTWAVVDIDDSTYWVDYPGMGFDANGFYVTGNLFLLDGSGSGFGGVFYRSFDKKPLLGGRTATYADIRDGDSSSVQVAQSFHRDEAPLFVSRSSSTQISVHTLINPFTTPSLQTAIVDVPAYFSPPGAPNVGGTLSVVGSRIMNAQFRNGFLYTAHAVSEPDGDGNAVARWYEINVGDWPESGPNPELLQSGSIDLGPDEHTFFPAIYSNKYGNVAMVVGKSNPDEFPSIMATGRLVEDALGTMRTPTQLFIGDSGASGRWGDYFDIAIDPDDDRTFWVVGEYQSSEGGWRTWLDKVTLEDLIPVDDFLFTRGQYTAGRVAELEASDDVYLEAVSQAKQVVELTVDGLSTTANPTQMHFLVESQLAGNVGDFDKRVELFNYIKNSWETIRAEQIKTNRDLIWTIKLDGNLSRFVNPGNLEMSARVTLMRTKFDPDAPAFDALFDAISWLVAE